MVQYTTPNYLCLTQMGWGCELFYAIIPTSFSYLLLFRYPYMLLLITCTYAIIVTLFVITCINGYITGILWCNVAAYCNTSAYHRVGRLYM